MDANDIRRQWADRTGEFSPAYYAHHGPNETSELLWRVLDRSVDRSAPVLELGCSCGRHLAHLHDRGFANPVGIELNDDAIDVMAEAYPALAREGEFHVDAIEDVVDTLPTDRFGAVYSVETLQHLHPDAGWVYAELVRIVDGVIVTVESEPDGGRPEGPGPDVTFVHDEVPLYYRDWKAIFTDLGCTQVETASTRRNVVRVFSPPS